MAWSYAGVRGRSPPLSPAIDATRRTVCRPPSLGSEHGHRRLRISCYLLAVAVARADGRRVMPGRLEVRLLGTVEARVDAGPPPVLAPKLRLLLAALAADAGRVVPVERLIDRVWDAPPAHARAGLQVLVARLRRALE